MPEDVERRGMLSVVVVHKDGDGKPAPGFFKMARELGRDTSDEVAFWIEELAFRLVVNPAAQDAT